MKIAARPPVQAASVVFVATRPTPALSMSESVEHGLNPYHPNHRIRPPITAMVRSCGGIGPPPSLLNLRPSRGPSMIAPAIATHPPMECTTVEPAKSWKFIPRFERKPFGEPMVARKPFDQYVDGFTISTEAGLEHGEASLHPEYEKRPE